MKVLVSYMFRANSLEIVHAHTDLEMRCWNTKAVTGKLGKVQGVDPTAIIITNVFEIPTSRFTQAEKDILKHWVGLIREFIESDDGVQDGVILPLIKELNE